MEVAQIGRTIAEQLGANPVLTEAICLGHDIGHAPFGHQGERVLNELTADIGGFEHNRQTLRVVDFLERPYPGIEGLNLMYETRLGFARHHGPYDKPEGDEFDDVNCSIEGQIADVSDRIAYNCHDLEDAMRGRLLDEQSVRGLRLIDDAYRKISADKIESVFIRRTRSAKTVIDTLVGDCIETSRQAIEKNNIRNLDDVLNSDQKLVCMSEKSEAGLSEIGAFLRENVFNTPQARQTDREIKRNLEILFEIICRKPDIMPYYYRRLADQSGLRRAVCDYIAGMTDRFCMKTLNENGDYTL